MFIKIIMALIAVAIVMLLAMLTTKIAFEVFNEMDYKRKVEELFNLIAPEEKDGKGCDCNHCGKKEQPEQEKVEQSEEKAEPEKAERLE